MDVKKGDTVFVSVKNNELNIETKKVKIKSSINLKSKSAVK